MDFPIFVLNDSYPFFEDIIVSINKAMEKYDSVYYREQKVRSLLDTHEDDRYTTNKLIQEITPSLKDKYICLRFKSKFGDYSAEDYIRTENILYQKGLIKPEDSPFYYDNGSLIIISRSNDFEGSLVDEAVSFIEAIDPDIRNDFFIGLSREHSVKWALSASIKESTYAASFHSDDPAPFMEYGKLGTYQAILPNAREFYMHNFSQDLIAPLEKYDIEKHSEILKTTIEFVKSGGNLDKTSEKLCQHKNTIRNRLKKAGEILNLNPFDLGDYESLALAVRIHICSGK